MPADGRTMIEAYRKLDAILVGKGAPPTSPAWFAALADYWLSGAFRMVIRKGRQVGASTIICPRIAVVTCLFGTYQQARGTRGTFGCFSTRQKEADERLYNIERTFADAGVRVKRRDDVLEIPGRPVVVQSFPATADVGRGPNWWAVWEDEMPVWADGDGANPAEKRDGAITPGCGSHDNARVYSAGTPQGFLDFHARLVEQGSGGSQRVYIGPSWHWRPELTEEKTRTLQPIERIWKREFAAIPQGDVTSVFALEDIDAAMEPRPAEVTLAEENERVLVIDASRGGDAWTYAIVRWVVEETPVDEENATPAPSGRAWCFVVAPREERAWDNEAQAFKVVARKRQDVAGDWWDFDPSVNGATRRDILAFEEVGEVPNAANTEAAIAFLATLARKPRPSGFGQERIRKVVQDNYEAGAMATLLRGAGLRPFEEKWTAPSKLRAVDRCDRLLRSRGIRLPAHTTLQRQMSEYSEKFTRTGALTYGGSGRHDDYAQVIVTACMADVSGVLPGTPHKFKNVRHEI